MRKWYSKEIPTTAVWVNGHPLIFDVLETEDPTLIRELDNCVRRAVGGVVSITEEQFQEEVKKKANGKLSAKGLSVPHKRQELSALPLDVRRVVEAGGGNPRKLGSIFARPQQPQKIVFQTQLQRPMPEPIEVPTPESFNVKPPTAKMKDVMPAKT